MNKNSQAQMKLKKLKKLPINNRNIWFAMAVIYMRLKMLNYAKGCLDQAEVINPQAKYLFYHKGRYCGKRHEYVVSKEKKFMRF